MKILRIFIALCLTIALTLTNLSKASAAVRSAVITTNVTTTLPDGSYRAGQVVPILVTFSGNVTVTGSPQLILSTGNPTTTAVDYSSGSGSPTITFIYTVAVGNISADLDYATNHSLILNGGTIVDATGKNANLKLPNPGMAGSLAANNNLIIDTSMPIFSFVSPVANAFINSITTSSTISYTLSEAIVNGSITMTRTGGAADVASPHICTLTGTALSIGGHNNLNLSDTTNGCTVTQSLVNGTIYTFAFNATDAAGNPAASVMNTNITFDTTPPVFSAVSPASNTLISSITTASAVSYTLSEAIASGSITMTWSNGAADGGSPHICTLKGTALLGGIHSNLDLSDTTNACTAAQSLIGGAVYTFTFDATDIAGNIATAVTNSNVTFDATGAVFSAIAPAANAFINSITTSSDVSYALSKAMVSGSITMTWTGGMADATSPHICTLTGTALSSGAHNNLDLSDTTNGCTVAQNLIDGAIYTFTFEGIDAAGIPAATITNINVTFDATAPTISIGAPSVSGTQVGPVTYTVTYADANFNASTLVPANIILNTTGDASGLVGITGSGLTRTVTISSITGNGTLGISIAPGTASDTAGNFAPAAGPSITFTIDRIFPSLSWIAPPSCADPPGCMYDVSNQSIQLAVDASDNNGISKVVFRRWDYNAKIWIDIGTINNPPYSLIFNASVLLPEYNQIDAKAYDFANNTYESWIFLYHLPIWPIYIPLIIQ